MFKEMRRKDRALDDQEIITLLDEGLYGVLSTCGIDGYAYGVPLSYARKGQNIYMHAAREGQKLEAFGQNNKVSFCVVGKVATLPKEFSTNYQSVIVFGKVCIIEGQEKEQALLALVEKYSADYIEEGRGYIERAQEKTTVFKLAIEHCTGKTRR